jgi:hypothetical protein
MPAIISGTGNGGYGWKIDSDNRGHVTAITEAQIDHASENGNRYNINTGCLTLTNASESAVLYIKNNECDDIHISSLVYNLGASACGSGDWKICVIRNPTAGTVVCCATAVDVNSNQNFGSNKTLTADVYKGGQGKTLTDGNRSIATRSPSNGRIIISLGALVLQKGSSLGVKITPPSGNTSAVVQVAAPLYIQKLQP